MGTGWQERRLASRAFLPSTHACSVLHREAPIQGLTVPQEAGPCSRTCRVREAVSAGEATALTQAQRRALGPVGSRSGLAQNLPLLGHSVLSAVLGARSWGYKLTPGPPTDPPPTEPY